jgi:hypothetical protein
MTSVVGAAKSTADFPLPIIFLHRPCPQNISSKAALHPPHTVLNRLKIRFMLLSPSWCSDKKNGFRNQRVSLV